MIDQYDDEDDEPIPFQIKYAALVLVFLVLLALKLMGF